MVLNLKYHNPDNESMVLINNHQSEIVAFGTIQSLRFLCQMRTIYMDGTFDYCVVNFAQLFTICGVRNRKKLPTRRYSSSSFSYKVEVDFELAIQEAVKST